MRQIYPNQIKYLIGFCFFSLIFITCQVKTKSIFNNTPNIHWEKTLEQNGINAIHSVIQNMEGDLAMVGYASSSRKEKDLSFLVMDKNGKTLIKNQYKIGGNQNDAANAIVQLFDGSYIVAGYTESSNSNNYIGKRDAWLLQIDQDGKMLWDTCLGTKWDDEFNALNIDNKGNLIVAGHFNNQKQVLKFDFSSKKKKLLWQYPSSQNLEQYSTSKVNSVIATIKNNIIITGEEVINKRQQLFVIKLNNEGQSQWEYLDQNAAGEKIINTQDGFIIIGALDIPNANTRKDILTLKLDENRKVIWRKVISEKYDDEGSSIVKLMNDNILIIGQSKSYDRGAKTFQFFSETLNNQTGDKINDKPIYHGTKYHEYAHDAIQLKDGSLVYIGRIQYSKNVADTDAWIVKTKPENIPSSREHPSLANPITINWTKPHKGILAFNEYPPKYPISLHVSSLKQINTDSISIFNGKSKMKFTIDEIEEDNNDNYKSVISGKIELFEGINEISASIKNKIGLAKTETIKVNYKRIKPNLHVWAFGILPPDGSLKHTQKDAKDFCNVFEDQADGGVFNNVTIHEHISPEETTGEYIINELEDISNAFNYNKILPTDVVMVYFSSHGNSEVFKGESVFYLEASNFDKNHQSTTTINFKTHILKPLDNVECAKFLFLDACKTGDIIGIKSSPKDKLDRAVQDLILADPSIRTILSCSPNQLSYEDDTWKNGAFTKALIEAFKNDKVSIGKRKRKIIADGNKDQILRINELNDFLKVRVPFLVDREGKGAQVPYIDTTIVKENLPIFDLSKNKN